MALSHTAPASATDFEAFVREHRPIIVRICWLYARNRPISTTSIKKFCSICGGASAGSKDAAGRHRGYIASA